jgi:hypothetical protein
MLAYLQTKGNVCLFVIDGEDQHDRQHNDNGKINNEEKQ